MKPKTPEERHPPPKKKEFFLGYAEQAAASLVLLLVLLPDFWATLTCYLFCLDLSYLMCSAQSVSPNQPIWQGLQGVLLKR